MSRMTALNWGEADASFFTVQDVGSPPFVRLEEQGPTRSGQLRPLHIRNAMRQATTI